MPQSLNILKERDPKSAWCPEETNIGRERERGERERGADTSDLHCLCCTNFTLKVPAYCVLLVHTAGVPRGKALNWGSHSLFSHEAVKEQLCRRAGLNLCDRIEHQSSIT